MQADEPGQREGDRHGGHKDERVPAGKPDEVDRDSEHNDGEQGGGDLKGQFQDRSQAAEVIEDHEGGDDRRRKQ